MVFIAFLSKFRNSTCGAFSMTGLCVAGLALTSCTNANPARGDRSQSGSDSAYYSGGARSGPNRANPSPSPSPSASPSPRPSTSPGPELAPSYTFRVGGVGYNGQSVKVPTNRILKVTFTPEIQDEAVKDKDGKRTGFFPDYSQLAVFIKVNGREQVTSLLSNGKVRDQETSRVMDFSTFFTRTCDKNDAACRQEVEITVYRPNADFRCYMWNFMCPYERVYPTYPWHGTLTVYTDDTVAPEEN